MATSSRTITLLLLGVLLAIVSVEAARAPGGDAAEVRVASALSGAPSALVASMAAISWVGGVLPSLAVAGCGALLLWWRGHRTEATGVAVGFVLVTLAAGVMKIAFDRARPPYALVVETDASYPSGHVSRAAWLAGALWMHLTRRRSPRVCWGLAGVAWVGLMALSRLVLGVHYLWDVVGAALLGALVAGIVWLLLDAAGGTWARVLGETPIRP